MSSTGAPLTSIKATNTPSLGLLGSLIHVDGGGLFDANLKGTPGLGNGRGMAMTGAPLMHSELPEGNACVDMEASALFSVAEFCSVEFGQVLLAADDAGGESWDPRDCFGMGGEKEKTLQEAVEACKLIWFWLADNSKRSSHTLSGQAFCSWSNALVHGH